MWEFLFAKSVPFAHPVWYELARVALGIGLIFLVTFLVQWRAEKVGTGQLISELIYPFVLIVMAGAWLASRGYDRGRIVLYELREQKELDQNIRYVPVVVARNGGSPEPLPEPDYAVPPVVVEFRRDLRRMRDLRNEG